jgi:hypothetical protein
MEVSKTMHDYHDYTFKIHYNASFLLFYIDTGNIQYYQTITPGQTYIEPYYCMPYICIPLYNGIRKSQAYGLIFYHPRGSFCDPYASYSEMPRLYTISNTPHGIFTQQPALMPTPHDNSVFSSPTQ